MTIINELFAESRFTKIINITTIDFRKGLIYFYYENFNNISNELVFSQSIILKKIHFTWN